MNIIVQKLKKDSVRSPEAMAEKYYSLLSELNDFRLTEREIQLIAFTAVKGNITDSTNRNDFCLMYNTSIPTINNIVSKLKKFGILVKNNDSSNNKQIVVNPKINLDFSKNLHLVISLKHDETTNVNQSQQ